MVKNKPTKNDSKVEDFFKKGNNLNKVKKILQELSTDERKEVRAKLNQLAKTNQLYQKLTKKDVEKLLNLLNDFDEQITLYKTNELRPISFSKVVTIFDVYETDEENFQPYISPLATVGTLPNSSSSTDTTSSEDASSSGESTEEEGGLLDGIFPSTSEQQGEDKGLFGLLGF